MKIRLHGEAQECAEAAVRLDRVFRVVSVSPPYPDRGTSSLVRVYVEVRLGQVPEPPAGDETGDPR